MGVDHADREARERCRCIERGDRNRGAVISDRGAEGRIGAQRRYKRNRLVHQVGITTAHHSLTVAERVVGKSQARLKVIVLAVLGVGREPVGAHLSEGDRGGIEDRVAVRTLYRGPVPLETQTVLQREGWREFEIILRECAERVGVVAGRDYIWLDAEDGGSVRLKVAGWRRRRDRKSTRLNSSHLGISYA